MNDLRQSCAVFCRNLRICELRIGIPKRLPDLQLQTELKNLPIYDLLAHHHGPYVFCTVLLPRRVV
jgi:hypothetical protein